MPNGDYEVIVYDDGTQVYCGPCAAGDGTVIEGEPFVIRYSTDGTPGGIFHHRCAPTGPQWYGLGEGAE